MLLEGTIQDGTIVLDQSPTLPNGERVTVEIQPLRTQGLVEFVRGLRHEMQTAGHAFRSKADIDSELAAVRDDWKQ